jgi:hypothetical protein
MMIPKSMKSEVELVDIPSSPCKLSERRFGHFPKYNSKSPFPLVESYFGTECKCSLAQNKKRESTAMPMLFSSLEIKL